MTEVITKDFSLYNGEIQVLSKSLDDSDDALYIRGLINSGLEDREGDVVTSKALESIMEQATNCNLHFEHGRQIKDIIGTITEAHLVEAGVEITARIRNKCTSYMRELFDDGIKLGMSIAGLVEYEQNNLSEISEWDLTEVSLVAIPADKKTMGTVTTKSLKQITEEIIWEAKGMAEEITVESITSLINEALTEVKEDYDAKIEELAGKVDECQTEITALKEQLAADEEETATEEEEEVVEEGLSEEGKNSDATETKSLEEKLEEMEKRLAEGIKLGIEDNLLEFFSKAMNTTPTARNPQFQFEDETKDLKESEDNVMSSKSLADKIVRGEI